MKYALATWNFAWDDAGALSALLNDMRDWGFEAASFHPDQLLGLSEGDRLAVAETVYALDFDVTIHGNCRQTPESIRETAGPFGTKLRNYTFDAAMTPDPRGYVYDAARIAEVLSATLEITAGVGARVAMEDFPLDAVAVEAFAADLAPVLVSPRIGILIDLGHMHLRRTQGAYFGNRSVDAYLNRVPLPIIELHVHDNDGLRDQHRHLGEGTLPIADAAAAVVAHASDAICTIEVAPSLHDGDIVAERPAIPDTLRRWREAVAK